MVYKSVVAPSDFPSPGDGIGPVSEARTSDFLPVRFPAPGVNLAILEVSAASVFEAFLMIFFLGDLSPTAAFTLGRTTLPAVALLAGTTPFSNL
jgi:hypothetical protein